MPRLQTHEQKRKLRTSEAGCGESRTPRFNREVPRIIPGIDSTRSFFGKGFTEGENWVVLVEKQEDEEQITLTRRIISFRKVGEHYRRSDEVHYLRLYEATTVESELQRVGFEVETTHSYGKYLLSKGHVAFIARKLYE